MARFSAVANPRSTKSSKYIKAPTIRLSSYCTRTLSEEQAMSLASIIGRGGLVGIVVLSDTIIAYGQFRVDKFNIMPNESIQLDCAPVKITPRDRDSDLVYKINVTLDFDSNANVDSLYVAHTTMTGIVYSRPDQYNQTTLSQPVPFRTKWKWKGTWKRHPNFTMIGDVTRSGAGAWSYTETQYRNGQLNMVMESRCHVEGD
jgi:hypothetical protein